MTRLIFVTQQLDPEHPVLAATLAQVTALARRVDELVVLANGPVAAAALPENCSARSFAGPTKAQRTVRFLAALEPELRRRPLAVVAHMSPVYAVLAAPLARPRRVPVLLWFTQQRGGRLLRVAERVSTAVLTVDPRSFPLRSRKLRAIGHGIDVDAFACREPSDGLRLLGLGRYAPVKRWDLALRALAEVPDAELDLYGPQLTEADRRCRPALERLATELGLGGRARFHDAVPHAHVPALLAGADALVNPTAGNAADKAVYEAAAACVPAFAASPVFDDLLPPELRFGTAEELAGRLRAFADGADRAARSAALGRELRARVVERHSVERWADAVLGAAG